LRALPQRAQRTGESFRLDSMRWIEVVSLLEYLETVPIARDKNVENLRFPVQYVLRPNLDFRGFSGTVASGAIKVGDRIVVAASGKESKVKSIVIDQTGAG